MKIDSEFVEAMHRPATEGDRIFYWSYCYSDKEFKRKTIRMMIQADTPIHLIYIYDKTGLIVTNQNYAHLSPRDKQQLKASKADFDSLSATKKRSLYKLADYEDPAESESEPLAQALYVLGNFVERNFNSGKRTIDFQAIVVGHLLVRAFRIVRAISRAQSYSTAEEDLLLLRSLYEIYCKLCFALRGKRNAKYLFDSDFGLSSGKFQYLYKDGKLRRHTIIDRKTKREIPRSRTFYEYISTSSFPEDVALFEVLYEYLSSFVHSGSRHIIRTWASSHGFSLIIEEDDNFKTFGLMLTILISAMIMQATLQIRNTSKISQWDIGLFCFVTRTIFQDIQTPNGSEIALLLPKLKERAARFPDKPPKMQRATKRA